MMSKFVTLPKIQVRRVYSLFFLLACFACKTSNASFISQIAPLSTKQKQLMKKYTWKPSCPVALEDLREISLTYWNFDQHSHQGKLIVNREVANEIVYIFKQLYLKKFPIERMEIMDVYKGDDNAAMNANNTSAFNCRAVTGHPNQFSLHSFGRAIDINPRINPYIKEQIILPATSTSYLDRNQKIPGIITKNNFIYNEFISHGWTWGGDWHSLKDYQHFEKS